MRKNGKSLVLLPSGMAINLEAVLYVRPAWHENHKVLAVRFLSQHSDLLIPQLDDAAALKSAIGGAA